MDRSTCLGTLRSITGLLVAGLPPGGERRHSQNPRAGIMRLCFVRQSAQHVGDSNRHAAIDPSRIVLERGLGIVPNVLVAG